MRVRILGCSGGIGIGLRTTSILVDDDILIDAGTGVGDLTLAEIAGIRHLFLTHSHLDHVCGLPLFLDSMFDEFAERPLIVHSRAETLTALRSHLFNDVLWPDFTKLPNREKPVVRFEPLTPGDVIAVGERKVHAVDVHHSVPSLGFCIERAGKVFAFSGDTMTNETLWPVLNAFPNVDVLVMEVSFPNSQDQLARRAKHYTPQMLALDLRRLEHDPQLWVTAMKPGEEDQIFEELTHALPARRLHRLKRGDVFDM